MDLPGRSGRNLRGSEEETIAFCREQLAASTVPRVVEFLADLPKSAAQKILRRELVEEERRKAASKGYGRPVRHDDRQRNRRHHPADAVRRDDRLGPTRSGRGANETRRRRVIRSK